MAKQTPIKYVIKRSLHHIAAKFGLHTRSLGEPQLLVLMYHRILPNSDKRTNFEEPGMFVSPSTFRKNLELLPRYFQFMELSEWLARKSAGLPLPKKSCAITFDDGWSDNYEYAFPILQEMGVPATIFLVSNMIGSSEMFWPERLSRTIYKIATSKPEYWLNPDINWLKHGYTDYKFNNIPPTQEELAQLIANAKRLPDQEIHTRLNAIQIDLGSNEIQLKPSLMSWEQVIEMMKSGLIDVGSHTCHHLRLNTQLPQETLKKEIITSKKQIEKQTGTPVKTFCFPNGDFTQEALSIVRSQYLGAVTTKNGWNSNSSDNHLLQRIGIHEDIANDETAFLARISGWF